MWLERIFPGMRKAIVGCMLASQENMDRRPNTFELFGADFMICENFYPWLIEINSSPDLGATTSVTARMCPQCLEDVVKGESIFMGNRRKQEFILKSNHFQKEIKIITLEVLILHICVR